jgi:hypothetical protein
MGDEYNEESLLSEYRVLWGEYPFLKNSSQAWGVPHLRRLRQ